MTQPQASAHVRRAEKHFRSICAEADRLSADEAVNALPDSHDPEAVARRWQKAALTARSSLHPLTGTREVKRKVQAVCLMLTEISRAETPELVSERFHARREEIEASLQELA